MPPKDRRGKVRARSIACRQECLQEGLSINYDGSRKMPPDRRQESGQGHDEDPRNVPPSCRRNSRQGQGQVKVRMANMPPGLPPSCRLKRRGKSSIVNLGGFRGLPSKEDVEVTQKLTPLLKGGWSYDGAEAVWDGSNVREDLRWEKLPPGINFPVLQNEVRAKVVVRSPNKVRLREGSIKCRRKRRQKAAKLPKVRVKPRARANGQVKVDTVPPRVPPRMPPED